MITSKPALLISPKVVCVAKTFSIAFDNRLLRLRHKLLLLALLCLFTGGCFSQSQNSDADPESETGEVSEMETYRQQLSEKIKNADVSILFIGNSHTAYNRIPDQVARLLEGEWPGKKIFCQSRLALGKSLAFHQADEQTNAEVNAGPWDFIVLQGHQFASGNADDQLSASSHFSQLAKRENCKVILYATWGHKNSEPAGMQIYQHLKTIAQKNGDYIAPVGIAWDRVRQQRPELELYLPDNNHASVHGGYLAALVITNTLTGRKVNTRLDNPYFSPVDAQTVDYFANLASEVVNEHKSALGSN